MELNENSNEITTIEEKQNRKNSLIVLILYFALFYVGASIISILVTIACSVVYSFRDLSYLPNSYIEKLLKTDVMAWTNILTYIVGLAIIVPLTHRLLKQDFENAKKNLKEIAKLVGIGVLLIYAGSILANILISILSFGNNNIGTSENQATLESIFLSSPLNMILIAIMTIVLAPILEEIIFRKAIFGLFKKRNFFVVIISALLFASIHVVPACLSMIIEGITSSINFKELYIEALFIISYFANGLALSYIYYKSNYNIVPSIIIHMINNIIAVLVILL